MNNLISIPRYHGSEYDGKIISNNQDLVVRINDSISHDKVELKNNRYFFNVSANSLKKIYPTEYYTDISNRAYLIVKDVDLEDREVVILDNDEFSSSLAKLSAKYFTNLEINNVLVLLKCDESKIKPQYNKFEAIKQDKQHNFYSKIHQEKSYAPLEQHGIIPLSDKISCVHCNWNLDYEQLNKNSSSPIAILNESAKHYQHLASNILMPALAKDNMYRCYQDQQQFTNLIQLHNNNSTQGIEHYHRIIGNNIAASTMDQISSNAIPTDSTIYFFTSIDKKLLLSKQNLFIYYLFRDSKQALKNLLVAKDDSRLEFLVAIEDSLDKITIPLTLWNPEGSKEDAVKKYKAERSFDLLNALVTAFPHDNSSMLNIVYTQAELASNLDKTTDLTGADTALRNQLIEQIKLIYQFILLPILEYIVDYLTKNPNAEYFQGLDLILKKVYLHPDNTDINQLPLAQFSQDEVENMES